MLVRDVMSRDVKAMRPEDTLQEAAERMRQLDVGPLPVCEDDRLVGMLTDRDITVRSAAAGRDPSQARVRDAMTPGVVTVYEDQDVQEAGELMQQHQIRRLVVLNRADRLTGIVSLGDLGVRTNKQVAGGALERVSEPAQPRR